MLKILILLYILPGFLLWAYSKFWENGSKLGMLSHMYLNKLDLFSINNGVLIFPESNKEFLISILNFGIAEGGKYCYNRFRELENDLREEFNINIEEE